MNDEDKTMKQRNERRDFLRILGGAVALGGAALVLGGVALGTGALKPPSRLRRRVVPEV